MRLWLAFVFMLWGAAAAMAAPRPGPLLPTAFVADPAERELKFQLDLGLWLLADASRNTGAYAAYGQRSLWYLNHQDAPFRVETNYRPELGAVLGPALARKWLDAWPENLRVSTAFVHESNGLEGDPSRGWNRGIGAVHLVTPRLLASVSVWKSFRVENRNPDLDRYAGDGELRFEADLSRWIAATRLRARSAFATDAPYDRFFTNLELGVHVEPRFLPAWIVPRRDRLPVELVAEWFVGTGEFLHDYDRSTNRLRLGLALRPLRLGD